MQDVTGPRKQSTAEQREKILQSYRGSSLTQKEFAARAGVSLSTLQAWLRKASDAKGPSPGFVAVPNLLSARPAPAAYRLQWPGGLTLEVRSGFAAEELATLLQLLPPL
jgi:transposase-like protein